jgi:hypothetical protein
VGIKAGLMCPWGQKSACAMDFRRSAFASAMPCKSPIRCYGRNRPVAYLAVGYWKPLVPEDWISIPGIVCTASFGASRTMNIARRHSSVAPCAACPGSRAADHGHIRQCPHDRDIFDRKVRRPKRCINQTAAIMVVASRDQRFQRAGLLPNTTRWNVTIIETAFPMSA